MKRSSSKENGLNIELISVKLQLQYVEKYKYENTFVYIPDRDKGELIKYLAPIVYMDDADEFAKRFDNAMYGLMIAQIEELPQFKRGQKQLVDVSDSSCLNELPFHKSKPNLY